MLPILCPNCRSEHISRLHRHVWGRLMTLLFRLYPFTCDDCHWKFWARYAAPPHEYLD